VKGVSLTALAFALLLFVINVPMPTIFHENRSTTLIASGGVLICLLVAAVLWLRRGGAPEEDPDVARPVTEVSYASAAIGVAIAMIGLGTQFGVFLVEIGAGLLVFGAAGVIRELRAERRLR
jgi:uncharacterized membrane protein YidH (DUF202 family)